ncbi:MAG TPA: YebC/PmpR family DNA-binding transcriptional regulator, partial [Armatimonadetes bacterium]|nr:YebC/PmpR family DNA-binding transcriptional regulator [Armatimonadota bacterium]
MAGHSRWHNIRERKTKQDARKGQIFSKLAREITVAVRQGGPDPEANPRLRMAIERARSFGMPMDNIQRTIQRAAGGGAEAAKLEEITYEGYGPHGVAFMLQVVTDNRNRAVAEIRRIFQQNGGSLGESGCVSWLFERKGVIV